MSSPSSQQPELPLLSKLPRGAEFDAANLADILTILQAQPDWITAAELLLRAGWAVHDSHKRYLRDLASQSDGQIISGQKGYRHIRHATIEEIDHAANWLQHQAVAMDIRARAIRRRKHQHSHMQQI